MAHARKETSKAAMLAAVAAIALLLAGCQGERETPPNTYIGQLDGSGKETAQTPDSPQKTYSEQNGQNLAAEEPHSNPAGATNEATAETSTLHDSEDDKGAVETESEDKAWDASEPELHGVAIGDGEAQVVRRFGAAIDSYTLDEKSDKIQVLEYDGFAVGMNGEQTVQYVELFGSGLSAGLSGLQIGDKPDAAVKLLGKPEKQTAYLLTYEADGALLKLDLDPGQNEIVSIKLLAAS
ncbi:hypothetical protein [Paenibacillus arenilitoris]|uniref:DUF4309 domain-containing protein n=1 Tax=Paenibacillus arenilitoris TaxID=2772299 RepID=A0A927CMX5_9BACL|nr:hypothetical protein [Paenibacillus arenilitoris]MBD2870222.1 hypothetical protein [Paenibacillus arenilitoris]